MRGVGLVKNSEEAASIRVRPVDLDENTCNVAGRFYFIQYY